MEFEDIDDIVEWLEPMDYETFWGRDQALLPGAVSAR